MSTHFFGGSFFGGEFFSTAVVTAPTVVTPTPAGKSSGRKRKWVIGNRSFYGTADEAADFAGVHELPEPVVAPKVAKPKRKAIVLADEPLKPVVEIEIRPMQGLEFGLLDGTVAQQQLMHAMGEQIASMRRAMLEEDDEDVMLLLWH